MKSIKKQIGRLSKGIVIGCFAFISVIAWGKQDKGRPSEYPVIRSNSPVRIDGILDEPLWKKADLAIKSRGIFDNPDSARTIAWLGYDSATIYVAFRCFVKNPAKLSSSQLSKDNELILKNEWVAFCLDSYNDGIVSYAFLVDPAGSQLEGSLNPTLDMTFSFSTDWKAASKISDSSYVVEMAIPLAMLPVSLKNNNAEMGVLMVRNDMETGQLVKLPINAKYIRDFQKVNLEGIIPTHPDHLSGIDIFKRLKYKQERFEASSLVGRSLGGDASIMDYYLFKKREIEGANALRKFSYAPRVAEIEKTFRETNYFKNLNLDYGFDTFLERSQTTAFMVLKSDTILYEKYFNGFSKDSIFTSFSVAKSFLSTLVGIAIDEGYIASEEDKITKYLPELIKIDPRFANIRIRHLLTMSSGIAYVEEGFPSDADITYIHPDLQKGILEKMRIEEAPGKHWHYNNYNPILLGMILERATHQSVSDYMNKELWQKMGGGQASWSLDEKGFEKMESGINCSIYDYARFARLIMNDGKYNGIQLIPVDWVHKTTQPLMHPKGYYDYLENNGLYYSYFWWGKRWSDPNKMNDFFALGNKGQYVYICPAKDLVIIHLGFEYGLASPGILSWPELFQQFAKDYPGTISD